MRLLVPVIALVLVTTDALAAGAPGEIAYQGFITQDNVPVEGMRNLEFAVFPDSTGGTSLWQEGHQAVPIAAGIFKVLLGKHHPLPADLFAAPNRFLETKVDGQALFPRTQLASVPYAFAAVRSDTASFAESGGAGESLWQQNGQDIYYSGGNVGVGITTPQSKLHVEGPTLADAYSTKPQTLGNGSGAGNLYFDHLLFSGSYGYGVADQFVEFQSNFNPSIGGQGMLARMIAYRSPAGYDSGEGKLKFTLRQGNGAIDALQIDRIGISTAGQPLGNGSSYANLLYNGLVFDGSYGYGVGDQYIQFNSGFNPGIGGQGPLARITANRLPEGYDTGRGKMTFATRSGASLTDVLTLEGSTATVAGELCVTGAKNAIVPTSQGMRKLYCDESTESWFSDRGEAQLVNGRARVDLDPLFLETVSISKAHPMKVWITYYGPHGNAYVVRGLTGFEVIDPDGGNADFSWQIEAKRKGFEGVRLQAADDAEGAPVSTASFGAGRIQP